MQVTKKKRRKKKKTPKVGEGPPKDGQPDMRGEMRAVAHGGIGGRIPRVADKGIGLKPRNVGGKRKHKCFCF